MKLCECGCGQPTRLATRNRRKQGHVKGEPLPLLPGHSPKRPAAPAASRPDHKICIRCREEKPVDDFPVDPRRPQRRYPYCKPCKAGYMRESFKRNQSARRLRERKYRIEKLYGITPQQYEELLAAQAGACAICGATEPKLNSNAVNYCSFSFHVDHCHATGTVRGLLCSRCNVGLGSFEDSARRLHRALRYLESPPALALRARGSGH